MTAILPTTSLHQFQIFIKQVYALPNNRHFETSELLCNVQRFAMRALKGIRKADPQKTKVNLIISFSFFISTLNRLNINLEDEVWKKFPYLCSYCAYCPCVCKENKLKEKQQTIVNPNLRPKSLAEVQKMFNQIYSANSRTLEHAGVHLAEEIGEFSEALLAYRGDRKNEDFREVLSEAADYFSCLVGVFNSLNVDLALELSKIYTNNCHECFKAPCECTFVSIARYHS